MRTKLPTEPSPFFVGITEAWLTRERSIVDGVTMPTPADRLNGHGCFADDARQDLANTITYLSVDDAVPGPTLSAMSRAIETQTAADIWRVYLELGGHGDAGTHFLYHAAIRGHVEALGTLAISAVANRRPQQDVAWTCLLSLVVGLLTENRDFSPDNHTVAHDVQDARQLGMGRLRIFGEMAAQVEAAWDHVEDEDKPEPKPSPMDQALAGLRGDDAFLRAVIEDRAEFVSKPKPAPEPVGPGKVVLNSLGAFAQSTSRHRSEPLDPVRGIVGKRLPLVGGDDRLMAARQAVVDRLPHCEEIIDRVLRRHVGQSHFTAHVIFVGDQGCGKSTLVRLISEAMGLPIDVVNCGREADASFGGTPSQYGTAQISRVLRHVAKSEIANPIMGLDEIEKAGDGKANGNFQDSLLAFTDPGTAARIDDPALNAAVDLSAVSYLATANSVEGLSDPMRDRFMIVKVPSPTWQHIGGLSRKILDDIARKQGDVRWAHRLDPDEIQVIRRFWPGGSIRKLREVLEAFMANREQSMGRH